MQKTFYITTTLPYVNADPHIGFAMEAIRADVIARHKRSEGYDVFFNTGTDEHGQKIYEGAIKENLDPQSYTDKYSDRFKDFCKLFNISYDAFIRTTDEKHVVAAQKMWNICMERGDIYKAEQEIKYCVGCEMEKTDSELNDDGKCPDHPNRELVITKEENYFFKFKKYEKELLKLYKNNLVKPDFRQNEIRKFVEGGLHDFSVSRLKSKMPWGVPVPNDAEHVMYVWFDALTSYIATLDWATNTTNNFDKYWLQNENDSVKNENKGGEIIREVVQYCGKDNNKAQSAIWQAMLLSAGIKNTSTININGHIISGGVKMSKSIGNVISPFDILEKYKSLTDYPEEVLRFVMCHEVSTYDDSDITLDSIHTAYTAHLQNGIGNQVSRILKLSSKYLNEDDIKIILDEIEKSELDKEFKKLLDDFKINEALHIVTDKIKKLDEYIQKEEPFKLVKNKEELSEEENKNNLDRGISIIKNSVSELLNISHHLYFFMPRTSMKIYEVVKENKALEVGLFNRG
jgi:methionyl-tRNA synthetase